MSKEAPVGFRAVRLAFELDTGATPEQVQTLIRLTERYCVVYQTLAHPPELTMTAGLVLGSDTLPVPCGSRAAAGQDRPLLPVPALKPADGARSAVLAHDAAVVRLTATCRSGCAARITWLD